MGNNNPVAEKIKQAKAKAQAGQGQSGTSATLVSDDAPMPQATTTGKKGGGKIVKQQVQTATSSAPKLLNLCGDGCGSPCKNKFLPGHDAKLHGWIKKLSRGAIGLESLPGQVRDGMYSKLKQGKTQDEHGNVTWTPVAPTTTEEDYLKILTGKGGVATSAE